MAYAKKRGQSVEYQGDSFSRSLTKDSGAIWEANEEANYKMVDMKGTIVASGDLVKSVDNLSMSFMVGKTATANLVGIHKLIVYLTDTSVAEMSYPIAEYKIDYKKLTARND